MEFYSVSVDILYMRILLGCQKLEIGEEINFAYKFHDIHKSRTSQDMDRALHTDFTNF